MPRPSLLESLGIGRFRQLSLVSQKEITCETLAEDQIR
jgi:hypothetical protein